MRGDRVKWPSHLSFLAFGLKAKSPCGRERAAMHRFFLILLGVILGLPQLFSQDAVAIPRGNISPKSSLLLVQEPYCELGYGSCGGKCSEEGKQSWDCPAEAHPCLHRGQRCTCEEADICKPKKKRSELTHPPAAASHAPRSGAQGANPAPHPSRQPSESNDTDQWRRVLSRLGL